MMENNKVATTTQEVAEKQLIGYLDTMGLAAKLTNNEKTQFLEISKAFGLNPFKREIFCSKYGETLSIIVGYETYIKRAERSGMLDGWGVVTEGSVEDNNLKAIITIHRKDRKMPFVHEVFYSEYVQKTSQGVVTKFWQKGITMTKKVAMAQGFRLCFNDELGGMPYSQEEMPEIIQDIKHEVIESVVIVDLKQDLLTLLDNSKHVINEEEKESLLINKKLVKYTDWTDDVLTKTIAHIKGLVKEREDKLQGAEHETKTQ